MIAEARGSEFLVRIEDIDQTRARPHWEEAIHTDLQWLGFTYPIPIRQSDRINAYDSALDALWGRGLLYPCTCTRRDIQAASSAPQEGAPLLGPDGTVYPGTCRAASTRTGARPHNVNLRLDMKMALGTLCKPLIFKEYGQGPNGEAGPRETPDCDAITQIGDVVLARKDFGTSYHLSVVVDDADQAITLVTRGQDLFEATPIHIILQRLLDLPTPRYHHHALIRDAAGKRLAKRDDARAIAAYREAGWRPEALRAHLLRHLTVPPLAPE